MDCLILLSSLKKMTTLREQIEQKLKNVLSPEYLEVINESPLHNVPRGSETHFKIVVVSPLFSGQTHLERHRFIYDILADELQNKIHALTITSWTSNEWKEKGGMSASSPLCLGGLKKK